MQKGLLERRSIKPIADIFYINFGSIEPIRRKIIQMISVLHNEEKLALWQRVKRQWKDYTNTSKYANRSFGAHATLGNLLIDLPGFETMCDIYLNRARIPKRMTPDEIQQDLFRMPIAIAICA